MAESTSLPSSKRLTAGSWGATGLYALGGVLTIGVGLALLRLGGAAELVRELAARTPAPRHELLPVVRGVGELDGFPPNTELLLEGRARHALFATDSTPRGARLGLLAWHEERLSGATARWVSVDTVCPTLGLALRGTDAPVLVSADYRLLDPLTRIPTDSAAGHSGGWRLTGVRAGERVTVAARTTSAAVGATLPLRATELRPGTAADWLAHEAAVRAASAVSAGTLAGGGALVVAGVLILVAGWRQRNGFVEPTESSGPRPVPAEAPRPIAARKPLIAAEPPPSPPHQPLPPHDGPAP